MSIVSIGRVYPIESVLDSWNLGGALDDAIARFLLK